MSNDLTLYERANWWNPDDGFHLLNHLNPGRFRFFDRFVHDWRDLRVLDIGCGGGFTCEFLARRGARAFGMDQSASSVSQAQAHAQSEGLQIEYAVGRAESLPYGDAEFDAVVCVDVLEHIPDWPRVLAEAARVLVPGGRFFFDTINRNLLSRFLMIGVLENVLGLIPRGTHDHRLFIRPDEMERSLASAGFSLRASTGMFVTWSPVYRRYDAVAGGPRTVMYLGCAEKESGRAGHIREVL